MTTEPLEVIWGRLVERVRRGGGPGVREDLETLYHDLQQEVFGERPAPSQQRSEIDPFDERIRLLLDALATLALLEPDDPSYPWDRALVLEVVGRNLEAADDYLTAARLFDGEARSGTGATGDEEDWAQSALAAAARNLALGGERAAAAALLPRLVPEDRPEVERLLAVS